MNLKPELYLKRLHDLAGRREQLSALLIDCVASGA